MIVIGDWETAAEYPQFAAALRAWVEAGGAVVGMHYVIGAVNGYLGGPLPDINAIIPVNTDEGYFIKPTRTSILVTCVTPSRWGLSDYVHEKRTGNTHR